MTLLYILLALVCIYMEISTKVNTRNIINKIGLTFIVVGCLVHLSDKPNVLIEIGVFLHFVCEVIHFNTKKFRRESDKEHYDLIEH